MFCSSGYTYFFVCVKKLDNCISFLGLILSSTRVCFTSFSPHFSYLILIFDKCILRSMCEV